MLSQEELEATYLKIYLRALKLTPEELKELKKKGHRYEHLKTIGENGLGYPSKKIENIEEKER